MELRRSVLLPYSVDSMFDLIERAEHYPEFLPWCTGVTIYERSDEWVAARLEFTYLGFSFGFKTRNAKCRPEWLQVRLVEGPFRRFHADWRLVPLGDQGCRINFDVSYEISDGLLDQVARPAVEYVSRSMMDAFVKRAESTLTESAPLPALEPAHGARPFGAPAPIAHTIETP